ncbi:MAG: 2-octaprenyl-6-methoxyphenyl hydroxylase [Alphaproteobacteria bacterium CG_4_10_14_0_2_um_filter_63_37]|nr:MAG: hypothetical protein AUJ55_06875 [Proteobacteria bacterium CG1_02_64_396]PJA24729.1 MAG: 2-octaprenyl-6-methoxyphenyl hydroxylase [Alphaproteobacteria bacterium CG_4_10_14_0_2_um_filter_63_37]
MGVQNDVLIAGGGLSGLTMATALAGQGLNVTVVDPAAAGGRPSGGETRISALARGSVEWLEHWGVWDLVRGAEPIKAVQVREAGQSGGALLHHSQMGEGAAGYVVPNDALLAALDRRVAEAGIAVIQGAGVASVLPWNDHVSVRLSDGATHRAALVIGADGQNSVVRRMLRLKSHSYHHNQYALIANVTPEKPHQGVAFERFIDAGPLALLPLPENRMAMVWTAKRKEAMQLLDLSDEQFCRALRIRFGDDLGDFSAPTPRRLFPLVLERAEHMVSKRAALIGNAAHSLHPLAGQGFNLGLRDVAELAERVLDRHRAGGDLGDAAVLDGYEQARRRDIDATIAFTEALNLLYTCPAPPVAWGRRQGLNLFDRFDELKKGLMRRTMGLHLAPPPLPTRQGETHE